MSNKQRGCLISKNQIDSRSNILFVPVTLDFLALSLKFNWPRVISDIGAKIVIFQIFERSVLLYVSIENMKKRNLQPNRRDRKQVLIPTALINDSQGIPKNIGM